MENSDGFLSRSKTIQRTRIVPLRWIGNFLGGYAGNHLVKCFDYDEEGKLGFAYKYHAKMWKVLNKPYEWWGTYYQVDIDKWKNEIDQMRIDMSDEGWDDYDSFGKAYWDKETDSESKDS